MESFVKDLYEHDYIGEYAKNNEESSDDEEMCIFISNST